MAVPVTLRCGCCCLLAVKVGQSSIGSFPQRPADARPEYVRAQRSCAFPVGRGLPRAVCRAGGSHAAARCVIRCPSIEHGPGTWLPTQGEPVDRPVVSCTVHDSEIYIVGFAGCAKPRLQTVPLMLSCTTLRFSNWNLPLPALAASLATTPPRRVHGFEGDARPWLAMKQFVGKVCCQRNT